MADNPFSAIDINTLFSPDDPWVLSANVSTRGGSGKTTCTALFGLYNRSKGVPTILIDTDRDGALTSIMIPSDRLRARISPNDKSIRPSLMDVINEYQANGDVIGKFREALMTTDAFPDDENLLLLPSDYRIRNIDFDNDLREAFLATINYLVKNCPPVLGPSVVLIDPSNHPYSVELALKVLSNRSRGGAFIVFPTQRYALRATMGTAKMTNDLNVKLLGYIPVKFSSTQKYTDFLNEMRIRGLPVLTGIRSSAKIQAPDHFWAISNKFLKEFAYPVNEMTRSLLPGFPPEPPPLTIPSKEASAVSPGTE